MGDCCCATTLKQNNISAIRSALYRTDFATKKEISKICDLSLAACTALLAEMIQEGQVKELSFATPNGGRPARRFALNPDYRHVLCMYTDNNSDSTGLVTRIYDLKGSILSEQYYPLTEIYPNDITSVVTACVTRDPKITSVGIGIAGLVSENGGIVSSVMHSLDGFNPASQLEEKLGIRVLTENDMYFASYGFYVLHPHEKPYSLSVLYWPSHCCAGAGSVVDGHIVVGSTKFAGELVYLPLSASTASKKEVLKQMQRGENTAALMSNAATCTIALINPDVIYLTGSATRDIRKEDIVDCCKKNIPEPHLPEFCIQADIRHEYMTGIFELARDNMCFPRL